MSHGRDLHGLTPSTYEATLAATCPAGIRSAGFWGWGVAAQALGTDPMWLFAPSCAYAAGMLALALYALVAPLLRSRRTSVAVRDDRRAAGDALRLHDVGRDQGRSVVAALLPLVALLAVLAVEPRGRGGVQAEPFFHSPSAPGPPLDPECRRRRLARAIRARGRDPRARSRGCSAAIARTGPRHRVAGSHDGRLQHPGDPAGRTFLRPLFMDGPGGGGVFTSEVEVGNLLHPLARLGTGSIWPAGDFRLDPTHRTATSALIVIAVSLGLGGVTLAWRRGDRALITYVIGTVVICLAIRSKGSPWVDAKSLAQASAAGRLPR